VPLEPQAFDLQAYLVCNREQVVTKDDRLSVIWQGRIQWVRDVVAMVADCRLYQGLMVFKNVAALRRNLRLPLNTLRTEGP
jgi:DNA-binding winged helix-turn-helix (wHTH) protein